MELSIIRLQEPDRGSSIRERRRRIRHKLHSPVYASFNSPSAGLSLELSELLDLSEDGFAVQTSERLEVNRLLNLSLDLPATKAHIHGTGEVIWSDGAGRGGIRFSGLPDGSQRLLKEWLFVNLLIACAKHAARTEPVSLPSEKKPPVSSTVVDAAIFAPVSDLSGMLSAVEAVRREVRSLGDDFNAALQLITARALSLTGANGAALAFLSDDKMICRASAGEPALPLGTAVDVKRGLSGECVRSGRTVACEDAETDMRVDREICRMLGIGSILAAPVFSDFKVVGLIEVFSPYPHAFAEVHQTALDRLVEIVPKAKVEVAKPTESTAAAEIPITGLPTASRTGAALVADPQPVWEPDIPAQEPLNGVPVRLGHIVLLVLTAAIVFLVAGYLSAPKIEKLWLSKPVSASGQAKAPVVTAQAAANPVTRPRTFDEVRRLAEQGDADAQWDMGYRYRNGEGVLPDDVEAARWFQRAADQGHTVAQGTLAAAYWAGRGVPKDLSKAYFWSVLAANHGDETSESRLQGLALQMTKREVVEAQQQADDWLRRHRAAK